ncbi:FOG: CheY-like receiver [hydrothermal vent metagenome]|uniref:FOG: CheY-like receiver n=1 Tax=hydrothermal vent metagenome TaxID=652676 RepID=A0A1W1EAF2_9ZZZZ
MKKLYERMVSTFKRSTEHTPEENRSDTASAAEILETFKIENQKIKIENQPFRLSGLLHILTNKLSKELKDQEHKLYYDVDQDVGRYLVGDNDYIEQVLRPVLKQLILLNTRSEIILHISKEKESRIIFDASNPKATLPKSFLEHFEQAAAVKNDPLQQDIIKAKHIATAMGGALEIKSSRRGGSHFLFSIPYIPDKHSKSNQEKLKSELKNKRVLFIGKDPYDTKYVQSIFTIFGLKIENMQFDLFERKKPDLSKYNMAILRSTDLTPKHIGFFKNFRQKDKSGFKLIIIHELFEHQTKIELTKPIADAELYSPVIIGDVEEILNHMYIFKSKAVKGISNMEVFDPASFIVTGQRDPTKEDMEYFRGAHIAVAEDSKVDQRVMRNILDVDGIKMFMVNNGKAMLELLEKEEIDIIFTDINMPIMDGLTMTKEIRNNPKYKNLPIISISSLAFQHEIKAMQLAGMNASIAKPISAQDVYRALERFLKITPKMQARYAQLIRERNAPAEYYGNPAVLNVKRGIEDAGSKLQYIELLNETLEIVEGTQEELRKLILEGNYLALQSYARSMITLYGNIHADEMVSMFKEIMVYLSTNKSKSFLAEYILLYKKNFKHLKKEIDAFKNYITQNVL